MIDWLVEIGSRVERFVGCLVKGSILNVTILIGYFVVFLTHSVYENIVMLTS